MANTPGMRLGLGVEAQPVGEAALRVPENLKRHCFMGGLWKSLEFAARKAGSRA